MRITALQRLIVQGALALVLIAASALAGERLKPSWLNYDASKKTVELRMIAAYNGNNGSWNFNGYYEGGMTVVVPVGWTVKLHFENPDGNYGHSLLVTDSYSMDAMPDKAGRDQVAISRAYTRSPEEGCVACEESLRFKAKRAGKYDFLCGVPGHGRAGMWVNLVVSAEAREPYVTVSDNALIETDQPGMP